MTCKLHLTYFIIFLSSRCEIKDESMKILIEAGPPMYLGFLIHMFLHFVIIQTEMVKQSGARVRNSTVPRYGALDDRPHA